MEFRFELTLKCHNGSVTEVSIKSRAFDSVHLSIEFANTIWLKNIRKLWKSLRQRKIFLHMALSTKHESIRKQKSIFKICSETFQKRIRYEATPKMNALDQFSKHLCYNFRNILPHSSKYIEDDRGDISKTEPSYQQNSLIFHDENTQSYWSYWTAGEITLFKD